MVSFDRERRAPMHQLSRRLFDLLREHGGDVSGLEPDNLAQIAHHFLAAEDQLGLDMQVGTWHKQLVNESSTLHDDLAALPFRLILTTSHDPLMETALRRKEDKSLSVGRYNYKGASRDLMSESEPSVDSPLLFHLYGHVDEPDSLVLTETQLLEYLTALISKSPPLPRDIKAALTQSKLFLFLGFGLDRWYLRILLHVLNVLRKRARGFAIENIGRPEGAPSEDAILFYKDFKLDIYRQDVSEFVQEIRTRCGPSRAGSPSRPAPRIASEPPSVFICHANEDKEKARLINDALKGNGIQAWLDKESLRGGDRWDSLVESTIGTIRYFIVLNSRALVDKTRERSYVNKEIKLALRSEDWRMGNFIIPVVIDDTPLLKILDKYQAVDLRSPDGLRDLVRAIKREDVKA